MNPVLLTFRLSSVGDEYVVRLEAEGHDSVESPFEIDLAPSSRLSNVIDQIDSNYATRDDLADIGSHLWAGLMPDAVAALFDRICAENEPRQPVYHFRLAVPPELEYLPWETLYDEKSRAFLSAHPRFCLMRDGPANSGGRRSSGPLSVLVVIPEGSNLQVAYEWKNLQNAVAKLGPAIRLELLDGLVTPDRLATRLDEGWDVLHFVGHGKVDGDQLVRIRLNDETRSDGELWAEAEQFAAIFADSGVRLAVLNCCLGAHPSPSRSLSGLGPFLLRAGLAAVVAMRYEIQDDDAIHYAREFYANLLEPEHTGRVDLAAKQAQRSLYLSHRPDNVRSFVTPVLFLSTGFERLEDMVASNGVVQQPVIAASTDITVPDALLRAVREGRCVPVIGPGLARGAAMRSHPLPPGPRELAERLAKSFAYPATQEFDAMDPADMVLADQMLQRVCQHVQWKCREEPFTLVSAIRDAYSEARPPVTFRAFAQWNIPGLVYTFFDGMMAQALKGHEYRVVNRISQAVPVTGDMPLLVNLRGTVDDAATLVLTEEDHDRLVWDDLVNLSPTVADLVTAGLGRSLMIAGASPRDPLVRRLINRLMPSGPSRMQGPIFFISEVHSQVDEAYWQRYNVVWVQAAPHAMVQAVTHAVTDGAQA